MPAPDEYAGGSVDPYIDPVSKILKNIPGFTNGAELESFEGTIFQAKAAEVASYISSCGTFSLDAWKRVHKICFADVYDWAGEIRTIRIYKGSTIFAYPEHIENEARKYFAQINESLKNETPDFESLVIIFCEINVIHPFREGNGRTQRIVFEEIFRRAGFVPDWSKCDQVEMIAAMRAAYKGDYALAEKLFNKITAEP